MSDLIATYGDGTQKVPFFKKPGSVTGTVLLALGGIFLLLHINPILMFLNSLMANTITFIGLLAALGAIAYCIVDPKVRKIVSELYFMLVRNVMGLVVEMDPIAIVKHHLEQMKEKIGDIQKNMGSLDGLIKESERRLEAKKRQFEDDVIRLKKCQDNGKRQEAQVYANSVTRLDGVIKRQEKRLEDARKWHKILGDLQYAAKLTVKDTENDINERVEEWNMIKKQHKVFTSVMGILQQNDQLNTFNMAMDHMAYDITQKLGEMENIINETGDIMTKIDLDNAISSDKAAALMEKYDKYGIEGILGRVNEASQNSSEGMLTDDRYKQVDVSKVVNANYEVVGEAKAQSTEVTKSSWFGNQ